MVWLRGGPHRLRARRGGVNPALAVVAVVAVGRVAPESRRDRRVAIALASANTTTRRGDGTATAASRRRRAVVAPDPRGHVQPPGFGHQVTVRAFARLHLAADGPLLVAAWLVVLFATASLSHRWFELPLLRLKDRFA